MRDYCTNIAFEIIKAKPYPISANAYHTSSKIIQDLKNILSKFDKITKLDAFLYDLKFSIAVVNPNERLNKFFIRFTLAIVLLDFTDWYKILNFWQTLIEQLWFKVTDITTYILFS